MRRAITLMQIHEGHECSHPRLTWGFDPGVVTCSCGARWRAAIEEPKGLAVKRYEYMKVNVSQEPPPDPHGIRKATIETAANRWAEQGWRTVAVMPSIGPGYADALLIERALTEEES